MDRSKPAEIEGLESSLLQMINAHHQSSIQLHENAGQPSSSYPFSYHYFCFWDFNLINELII